MESNVQKLTDYWLEKLVKVDHETNWVACPLCNEEWTRMRPCEYFQVPGQRLVKGVCVVCAETLVRFDLVAAESPQQGTTVQIKYNGTRLPKNAYAVITGSGFTFVAQTDGTCHPIRFKESGDKEESLSNNVYALWETIKHRIKYPKVDISPREAVAMKRRGKTQQSWVDEE